MAELATKNLDQMVAEQAVTAQASAPDRDLDFSRGSVFRALAEGYSSLAMWLQGLVLRVLAFARASTSQGQDLDSWMADFGLSRTGAVAARGMVTFSRFTPGVGALVPFGAIVKTQDAVWSYRVIADQDEGQDTVQQGYSIPPGQSAITVPVEAVLAGAGGNAAPNTLTLLSTAVPGVDTVTNATPIVGGAEPETDEAFLIRFRAYIAALPRATRAAIDYAISQVRPGLTWSVLEDEQADGTPRGAHFSVFVDDGSGAISADLLERLSAAVEEVRALGVSYSIAPALTRTASVSMAIAVPVGEDRAAVVGAVGLALTNYINGLPLGAGLSYTKLASVAYATTPLVTNVTSLLLNGGSADIAPSPRQVVRAGSIVVI